MRKESDLRPYQRATVDFGLKEGKVFLMDEMGLGKTVTALTLIDYWIYGCFAADCALVVATKSIVESVWEQEAAQWEHTKHLTFSAIHGRTEKHRLAGMKKKADVYLVSRDNIKWLMAQYGGTNIPQGILIVDESSSFKNPKAQRTKALMRAAASVGYTLLLTGTPRPKNLEDLWSQMYLIDQGARLGKSIGAFRRNFMENHTRPGDNYPTWKERKGAQEEVMALIGDVCTAKKTRDYIDLPPRITTNIEVYLPDKIKKAYKQFQADRVLGMIEEILAAPEERASEIFAANKAALLIKLHQFAGGALYDEDRNVIKIHDAKMDALAEYLEVLDGSPVIVVYAYQHERDRMLKRFKKMGIRQYKGPKDVEDWNAGRIPILTGHPASMGHGLNLQYGGNRVLHYSLTTNLEYKLQVDARVDRSGQKADNVFIDHLTCPGTVDVRIYNRLLEKNMGQNELMDELGKDLLREFAPRRFKEKFGSVLNL